MEKSFIIIIIISFFTSMLCAQDSLCVFKTSSGVLAKFDGKKRPLNKGDFLNKKSTVYITSPSDIILIDSKGEAFNLEDVASYTYESILNHKAIEGQKSLTSKYFELIWDELLSRKSGKTIVGGVFRGDILMEFPIDSTKTASSKLTFSWKTQTDASQYFVFIKSKNFDEVYKFATNGNELTLYKDNPIFFEGNGFEWSVSTSEFPNFKNIPFYAFVWIDRSEYEKLKSNYKDLIEDLKAVGLSITEIEDTLCENYGVCKN
ncbi:hypothetical protein [Flavivirga rizhaonensis]|uniref:Uncharacterized protein n=1 Tax=Flavivirga rizhaonensis TaxID=2559571 RepID=A0A4S1E323_9FLAO|nr:hypothetical protein [Flavivirga rizhaonensis]TGV04835.1 hypothetical protein EM932_01565 [Flavivirga rizhaonensis]